ncbi:MULTISPECIES: hypothetical protein [unclassified Pseudovibrio]|uniref:hypothetical protein n=1 Tax=unclassified Pseudovibrio TaxID=2627060 RepID=UPI0007AE70B1|nr:MULTISPECIES: hypothetical protein [unclassified Pseudovibrio]KZL02214.1 hypothetical protein PsW74_01312 [Pseudovibrio sp. W74]KZL08240.1 hypothetical protein PsAD14_03387 [Pseudovibrio sp. Ad14]
MACSSDEPTTTRDGVFLRSAVRLMLLSLVVMLLALSCLYFVPIYIAPFISCALYLVLWTYEKRIGVWSPVTRLMSVFYMVLAVARFAVEDIAWSAYSAPIIYSALAVLILSLLALGKPFTIFYSKGNGFYALHCRVSLMWGLLHVCAAFSSIYLMPNILFLYVPMGLMVLGAFGTIWLNFVTMGAKFGRQPRFELGKFEFEQVQNERQRDEFYRLIATAYVSDLQRAAGSHKKIDKAKIELEHRNSDAKRSGCQVPFLVRHQGKAVGGICMFLDHADKGLPIESETDFNAAVFRKRGAVAEVGRLGVMPRYRLERNVLIGLFKCIVEKSAELRVHTIVNDSFAFQEKLYSKIGFHAMPDGYYSGGEEDSTGYGLTAIPMVMDLADAIRLDTQTSTGKEVMECLQPYVIERFFKILALQEVWESFKGLALAKGGLRHEAQQL